MYLCVFFFTFYCPIKAFMPQRKIMFQDSISGQTVQIIERKLSKHWWIPVLTKHEVTSIVGQNRIDFPSILSWRSLEVRLKRKDIVRVGRDNTSVSVDQ